MYTHYCILALVKQPNNNENPMYIMMHILKMDNIIKVASVLESLQVRSVCVCVLVVKVSSLIEVYVCLP